MIRAMTIVLHDVCQTTMSQPLFVSITRWTAICARLISPLSPALESFAVPLMSGRPNVRLHMVTGQIAVPHVVVVSNSEVEHYPCSV